MVWVEGVNKSIVSSTSSVAKFLDQEIVSIHVVGVQLYKHYREVVLKVVKLQGTIMYIIQLVSLFLQAVELDIIHDQAVEASENVKEGNEQVRGVSLAMDIVYRLSVNKHYDG